MLSRKISTYGKRGKRTVSTSNDTVLSPVRAVPAPAPVDLLPLEVLSPAIRRIWQARHKPSPAPAKRKVQPAPAKQQQPVEPSPVTRTPLADKSNHAWSPSPSPLTKKHPSPARSKKLSPVFKKPILRTYKSRGAAAKRPAVVPDSSSASSSSDDEDDPGPSHRARTMKARPLVEDSDSDITPPARSTKNAPARRTTASKASALPPPPSPSVISISSDSEDDDYEPSPIALRRRTTTAKKAAPTKQRTSSPSSPGRTMRGKRDIKGKAPTPAPPTPAAAEDVIEISDSDSDNESAVASSSKTSAAPITRLASPVAIHKSPLRFRPKAGLVPMVVLTPLRRPTLSHAANAHARPSPARASFVARTATPIRAVMRRKGTPLRAHPRGDTAHPPRALSDSDPSLDCIPIPPPSVAPGAPPPYLLPLLHECGQDAPYAFDSFLEVFPFDPLHAHSHSHSHSKPASAMVYRKLGEASYSEVYAIGDVVLKIVPLRDEAAQSLKCAAGNGQEEEEEEWDVPDESDVQDVLREICITREMGALCPGFVQLLKALVVRGPYPELLLKLWDEYDDARKSESIRPDGFPATQAYAILVLPNLGTDLETFTFKPSNGWSQASAIFWQVAAALRTAEEKAQFEHRDLHWGQILVQRVEAANANATADVRATIIDLGLSRMRVGAANAPLWAPFDEEIFEGKGDYQFDVYRMMRAHNAGEWAAFRPLTNVMWLHYLAVKLTQGKRLRAPSSVRERRCAEGLFEAEQALAACVSKRKGARGKAKAAPAFTSVADVVRWAEERGWM